jgi:hypothetical protein
VTNERIRWWNTFVLLPIFVVLGAGWVFLDAPARWWFFGGAMVIVLLNGASQTVLLLRYIRAKQAQD